MHVFRSFALVVVVLGLAASPSAAQQRPAAPPQPLRGYLIGGGGTSIGVPDPAMTLSAEIAENVNPDVQVYMSAGYYDNVDVAGRAGSAHGGRFVSHNDDRKAVAVSRVATADVRSRSAAKSSCRPAWPCGRMWAAAWVR